VLNGIACLVELTGFDFEGEPGVVTTGEMMALGARLATFTFFATRQLLQFAVQLLDLPAPGLLVLNGGRGERAWRLIRNHPLNAVLFLDQFNLPRILLVLHTIIDHQLGGLTVLEQRLYPFPQTRCRQLISLQIIADDIVADPFQMLGQMATGIVCWAADQIFDLLPFVYHPSTISANSPSSESPIIIQSLQNLRGESSPNQDIPPN